VQARHVSVSAGRQAPSLARPAPTQWWHRQLPGPTTSSIPPPRHPPARHLAQVPPSRLRFSTSSMQRQDGVPITANSADSSLRVTLFPGRPRSARQAPASAGCRGWQTPAPPALSQAPTIHTQQDTHGAPVSTNARHRANMSQTPLQPNKLQSRSGQWLQAAADSNPVWQQCQLNRTPHSSHCLAS